jgi:hypothetical protein
MSAEHIEHCFRSALSDAFSIDEIRGVVVSSSEDYNNVDVTTLEHSRPTAFTFVSTGGDMTSDGVIAVDQGMFGIGFEAPYSFEDPEQYTRSEGYCVAPISVIDPTGDGCVAYTLSLRTLPASSLSRNTSLLLFTSLGSPRKIGTPLFWVWTSMHCCDETSDKAGCATWDVPWTYALEDPSIYPDPPYWAEKVSITTSMTSTIIITFTITILSITKHFNRHSCIFNVHLDYNHHQKRC